MYLTLITGALLKQLVLHLCHMHACTIIYDTDSHNVQHVPLHP